MAKSLILTAAQAGTNLLNGNYMAPGGALVNKSTEAQAQGVSRIAGTLSLMAIRVSTDGNSRVLTSRKNTANGNQSVSISNGASGVYEDATNSDSLSAGDKFNRVWSRSGGSSNAYWQRFVFEASSDHAALYFAHGGVSNISSASTTTYIGISGGGSANTTEANRKYRVRTAGTLTNGHVYVSANARTTTTTFKSRINGGDGTISIAFGSGITGLIEDTTHTDSLSAGDDVNWAVATGTGTETLTPQILGCGITVTGTPQNDLFGASSGTARTASGTASFLPIGGGWSGSMTTTEANASVRHGFAGTASRLRCYVSANTYTGTATATFRKNTADGNQTISIGSGLTGLFEDTTNSDTFDADDDCCFKLINGTANSLTLEWIGLTETPTLPTQDLSPTALFTNSQTFYAPTVSATYALTPGLFTNSQTFHAPTVTPGAVDLTPSLVTNTSTIYAPEIASGWALSPGLLTNTQTFYAATVTVGGVELAPSLVTNGQTFYGPTITAGAVDLAPGVVTNSQAFYSATITTGAVTVAPPLYTNSQTFYGPAVTSVYPLAPSLLTNSQTFYGASIAVAPVYLTPSLFTNTQTFFQHSFRAITGKSASTTVSVTGQGAGQTVSGWVGKTSEEAVSGWVGKSAA